MNMLCRTMRPIAFLGIIFLHSSSHGQAFLKGGGSPKAHDLARAGRRAHGMAPTPRITTIGPLRVLDPFQENPEGLQKGDMVKVIADELKFYHMRRFKEDGYDPKGDVGEILELKLTSEKHDNAIITAHRPVFVAFTYPQRFRAHLEFEEVRKATEDELKEYEAQREKAEQDAAAAKEGD